MTSVGGSGNLPSFLPKLCCCHSLTVWHHNQTLVRLPTQEMSFNASLLTGLVKGKPAFCSEWKPRQWLAGDVVLSTPAPSSQQQHPSPVCSDPPPCLAPAHTALFSPEIMPQHKLWLLHPWRWLPHLLSISSSSLAAGVSHVGAGGCVQAAGGLSASSLVD